MELTTVVMVADSFRAGTMMETSRPDACGASLRFGERRARRGSVKKGRSQGTADSNSTALLHLPGEGLQLLFQGIELALDLTKVVIAAIQWDAIL